MVRGSSHVHSSWNEIFAPLQEKIDAIYSNFGRDEITPPREDIFAAFTLPLSAVKCVIVGQDPYPTLGNAHGLAFSVRKTVGVIPASLRNIYKELEADLGYPTPSHGNLESWGTQGVLLLNRVLTTRVGESSAHESLGWKEVTDAIAREVGIRGAVAILWGKQAQELKHHFSDFVESVHPSPLSAYRGFFGSKPFSRVNSILESKGMEPITWKIE